MTISKTASTPLRERMIADMKARNLGRHSQRSHIASCERFAAWLGRSPDTATAADVKAFQLHLIESGASIGNRNRIMIGVKFLLRVTLRRHDLAAEIYHLREPQKVPLVISQQEIIRLLAMAVSLKARAMLSLSYGCGLRASEVVQLKVGDIASDQKIIRNVQAKGRKDRHHLGAAQLGLGDDAPSTCAHDRPGRRDFDGWQEVAWQRRRVWPGQHDGQS